jgi:small-conductance mechanosensitive channel
VTGDVIDIGLVRLHVMELAGSGVDLFPTGRIVVFSNSVLFQATTPLFKQIPGTEYSWHEVAIDLAASANYKLVQDKLLEAVNSVYEKYRDELERQHGAVSERIDIPLIAPKPQPRLQFSDSGLELQVRYPVDIRKAADIDDEVTRKLIDLINSNSDLKASVVGLPKIQAAVKG